MLKPALSIAVLLSPIASTAAAQTPSVEDAARAFLAAGPDARDAAFLTLEAVAPPDRIAALLSERLERAAGVLRKGSTLDQLRRLAAVRRELDDAREHALELIFDEERYFYPYNPPAVDASKAAEYPAVQRTVDTLVKAVEEVWSSTKKVKLSKDFRAAVDDLTWTIDRRTEFSGYADLPEDLPAWCAGIPALATVTLRDFGWEAAERERLAYSRAVVEFNERTLAWAQRAKKELPDAARPGKPEIDQVRITNAYRLMFGRVALAWSPLLQQATQGHSDYMSKWGILTHFEEKDPERYDVVKRARLVGYDDATGENCSMGRADPKSAHEGWAQSSGHHRNILNPAHREMASAESGGYWTQNFGNRKVTLEELRE